MAEHAHFSFQCKTRWERGGNVDNRQIRETAAAADVSQPALLFI